MKILLFTRGLMHGGAERQLCLLANGLAARGHAVTVMVYYGGLPLERDLDLGPGGVSLEIVAKRGRRETLGFLWRLARAIRAGDYDVIYSFLPLPNVLVALLRPVLGRVRLAWGLRSSSMDWAHYDRLVAAAARLERLLCRVPDVLIANSSAGREDFEALGYPADRLHVVENGIDTEVFRFDQEARGAIRRQWKVVESEVLIGVVARVDPMKGVDTFLAAAGIVARQMPQCRFVWVGGEATAEIRAEAERLGLAAVLHFAKPRDDMPSVYSALDVLCLPSSFGEGFPNALAEAMACERAVVATDVGGVAAVIGSQGAVVPPRNVGALAQALIVAAQAVAPGDACRPSARAWIREAYGMQKTILRTEAILARNPP